MATAPKKVCLELAAEFFQFDVFGESGDGESGVVDQDIQATVFADDGVNRAGKGIEVGDVKRADVKLAGDTCCSCGLIKSIAAAEVAHRGDDAESGPGQFYRGEQAEAAGGTGDESNLVRHGS
jgi:hypothetical protein